MGYHLYNPHENKVLLVMMRYLRIGSNIQEVSRSLTLLKASGSINDVTPIHRSARIPHDMFSISMTSMGIEGYLRCVFDSESWITCDNTNGNTTLSKVQGVSLRITSGVRRNRLEQGLAHKSVILEVFHDLRGDCRVVYHDLCLGRPTAKGVGLRVESSHTGNHREDDFTPLETIRRFLGIIGSKSLSSSNGRPLSWRGGVLLPKRSQTILDVPLGFVGLYTHHLTLSNLRLPIPEFIYEVLNYLKVHIFRLNPFGMVKLTTFVVMCKAYGGEPNLDMLRAFLNLGHVSNWLALSNRGGADIPKALTKPMTHIKG
ncbi:hypothetical protein Tco_1456766 [Tanacetum coccineum]